MSVRERFCDQDVVPEHHILVTERSLAREGAFQVF